MRSRFAIIGRSVAGKGICHLARSCPPSKTRTIDRPNEFQIRGWPDWLHFDAEVEQLEGAVLDRGELRIEDEARLRGAVHGHDIAGHGGEVSEEGAEAVLERAAEITSIFGEPTPAWTRGCNALIKGCCCDNSSLTRASRASSAMAPERGKCAIDR